MKSILLFFTFIKNILSKDKKLKIEGDIKGIRFGFENVQDEEEEVAVDVELDEPAEPTRTTPPLPDRIRAARPLPERREAESTGTETPETRDIDYTLVVPPLPERRESTPVSSISADSSTDELLEFLIQRLAQERKDTGSKNPKSR